MGSELSPILVRVPPPAPWRDEEDERRFGQSSASPLLSSSESDTRHVSFLGTAESQPRPSVTTSTSSIKKSFMQRREALKRRPSAIKVVASKSKRKHQTFMALNFILVLIGTLGIVLTIKDRENAQLGFRDLRKVKQAYFDVGFYPMSGMIMLLTGGCLDGISMMIFLCGFCCECQYYRHYMRFVFINLLLAITATIVLFLTEDNADRYLRRYFKMVMKSEYAATPSPEPIGNFVDVVQSAAACCGYTGPNDWKDSMWWQFGASTQSAPHSCCEADAQNLRIPMCRLESAVLYHQGCEDRVFSVVGRFRAAAKYVGLLKIVFLIAVVVICSLLYKDTWYVKFARKMRAEISAEEEEPRRVSVLSSLSPGNGGAPSSAVYEDRLLERLFDTGRLQDPNEL